MTLKHKYRIRFNWHYELYTFYKHAASKEQAKKLCMDELTKRLGLPKSHVGKYFDGTKDNVDIREVN